MLYRQTTLERAEPDSTEATALLVKVVISIAHNEQRLVRPLGRYLGAHEPAYVSITVEGVAEKQYGSFPVAFWFRLAQGTEADPGLLDAYGRDMANGIRDIMLHRLRR